MKFLGGGNMFVIVFRTVLIVGGFIYLGSNLIATNEAEFLAQNSYLQEAAVIQRDFEQNELYGEKNTPLERLNTHRWAYYGLLLLPSWLDYTDPLYGRHLVQHY